MVKATGIIILAHGSKLKKANALILKTIQRLKKILPLPDIQPAYLQFSVPNLAKSIAHLVKKEYKRIVIVPFFLFNGNHVNRDIPQALKKASAQYPKVKFIYGKNLGMDKRLTDIIRDRIQEALRRCH